jgi:hypothetical protein
VAGISVACSCAASNKSGTRSEDTGFDAVGATGAELDDRATCNSRRHTRGLARDESLEMKRGEGLNELGFGDRSSDAEHGFAGKPRTQRALALCVVSSPGSPLAIIGILASIGVLIDASGTCV